MSYKDKKNYKVMKRDGTIKGSKNTVADPRTKDEIKKNTLCEECK